MTSVSLGFGVSCRQAHECRRVAGRKVCFKAGRQVCICTYAALTVCGGGVSVVSLVGNVGVCEAASQWGWCTWERRLLRAISETRK